MDLPSSTKLPHPKWGEALASFFLPPYYGRCIAPTSVSLELSPHSAQIISQVAESSFCLLAAEEEAASSPSSKSAAPSQRLANLLFVPGMAREAKPTKRDKLERDPRQD